MLKHKSFIFALCMILLVSVLLLTACGEEQDETTITGITISAPSKVVYEVGSTIDLKGAKLTIKYSDGTKSDAQAIVKSGALISGVSVDTDTLVETGIRKVTVSYTYNNNTYSASFNVTVKAEHDYDDWAWVDNKEPTLTEGSSATHTCTLCGKTETQFVPALSDNSWSVGNDTATCTKGGYIEYSHATYGSVYIDTQAKGHIGVQHISRQEATCFAEGHNEHYYCPVCKCCFADADCTTATEITIAKTSHNYSNTWIIVTNPTMIKEGVACCECTNPGCTSSAVGHTKNKLIEPFSDVQFGTWKAIEYKAPTCTEDGYQKFEYTGADNDLLGLVAYDIITALGHNPADSWENDETGHYHICQDCYAHVGTEEHNYYGVSSTNCNICGHERDNKNLVINNMASVAVASRSSDDQRKNFWTDSFVTLSEAGISKPVGAMEAGDTLAKYTANANAWDIYPAINISQFTASLSELNKSDYISIWMYTDTTSLKAFQLQVGSVRGDGKYDWWSTTSHTACAMTTFSNAMVQNAWYEFRLTVADVEAMMQKQGFGNSVPTWLCLRYQVQNSGDSIYLYSVEFHKETSYNVSIATGVENNISVSIANGKEYPLNDVKVTANGLDNLQYITVKQGDKEIARLGKDGGSFTMPYGDVQLDLGSVNTELTALALGVTKSGNIGINDEFYNSFFNSYDVEVWKDGTKLEDGYAIDGDILTVNSFGTYQIKYQLKDVENNNCGVLTRMAYTDILNVMQVMDNSIVKSSNHPTWYDISMRTLDEAGISKPANAVDVGNNIATVLSNDWHVYFAINLGDFSDNIYSLDDESSIVIWVYSDANVVYNFAYQLGDINFDGIYPWWGTSEHTQVTTKLNSASLVKNQWSAITLTVAEIKSAIISQGFEEGATPNWLLFYINYSQNAHINIYSVEYQHIHSLDENHVCTICGKQMDENHIYDSVLDDTCNVCGYKRELGDCVINTMDSASQVTITGEANKKANQIYEYVTLADEGLSKPTGALDAGEKAVKFTIVKDYYMYSAFDISGITNALSELNDDDYFSLWVYHANGIWNENWYMLGDLNANGQFDYWNTTKHTDKMTKVSDTSFFGGKKVWYELKFTVAQIKAAMSTQGITEYNPGWIMFQINTPTDGDWYFYSLEYHKAQSN